MFSSKPIPFIENFKVTSVKVLKKRHLATVFQDASYPKDRMPFYIYGTEQQLHIDHILLKYPSIQLSADCVELNLAQGILTQGQREKGVIAHITDYYEYTMQPFPEIKKHGSSFFFQEGRKFDVELYEDPVPDPNQNGPGLDDVDSDIPFARGTIRLPRKDKGCLYIDSYFINKDPTAKYEVKDGEIKERPLDKPFNKYYYDKFEKKTEIHWYEEKNIEQKEKIDEIKNINEPKM